MRLARTRLLIEADNRLRRLERAWKASSGHEDLNHYLRELRRTGNDAQADEIASPHITPHITAYRSHVRDITIGRYDRGYRAREEEARNAAAGRAHDIARKLGELPGRFFRIGGGYSHGPWVAELAKFHNSGHGHQGVSFGQHPLRGKLYRFVNSDAAKDLHDSILHHYGNGRYSSELSISKNPGSHHHVRLTRNVRTKQS